MDGSEPTDPDFEIPTGGLTAQQRKRALTLLETHLVGRHEHMIGFQGNQDMGNAQPDLARFLDFHLNNVGDPFQQGNYQPNTKVVERAVLDRYAALWRADRPYDADNPDSYWGYVLTMGSTEGNLYALASARDYLSGRKLSASPAAAPSRWCTCRRRHPRTPCRRPATATPPPATPPRRTRATPTGPWRSTPRTPTTR